MEHGIRYPEGKIHEDNLTTYKLYAAAKQVTYIQHSLYFYYKRSGSITNINKKTLQINTKIEAAKEAIKYFNGNDELEDAAKSALFWGLIIKLNEAIKNGTSNTDEIISEIVKNNFAAIKCLSKKQKIYLAMLSKNHGKPYILYRKIINRRSK